MRQVNEAIKIFTKFSKMEEIIKGRNLIIGRQHIDVVEEKENVSNFSHTQVHNLDKEYIKDEEYDNLFLILFSNMPQYSEAKYLDLVFSKVRPNGLIILYCPHKMYFRNPDIFKMIPHDMALELRNVRENKFELKDMATCKYDGEFVEENMENIEYSFYMVLHKMNNLFRKNVEIREDDGQMVSLDD